MTGISLSLHDQVAIITGGSRGIGAAAVRMFVAAGARVLFTYQRAEEQARALIAECGEDRCRALRGDFGSLDRFAPELVEAAVSTFGKLDILVVNHGIWPPDNVAVDEMTDAQWSRTVAVNLDSVFRLIRAATAQMKRGRAGGNIVLVSSTAGQRGEAFHCDYAATKGALISMTKGLSTELAPNRIRVNCVAPGWVDTDMAAPALNGPHRDAVLRAIPVGRVATPDEVAAPILFLCTAHAGFITGEILNVNGGAVLAG